MRKRKRKRERRIRRRDEDENEEKEKKEKKNEKKREEERRRGEIAPNSMLICRHNRLFMFFLRELDTTRLKAGTLNEK